MQWLPDSSPAKLGDHFVTNTLLLGTHTNRNETDYISVASVDVPKPEFAAPSSALDVSQIKRVSPDFGIVHDGEVNRARVNPSNSNIIASLTASGDALIFDRSDSNLQQAWSNNDKSTYPLHRLKHHTKDAWALSWSFESPTVLATGSEDSTVALWDISQGSKEVTPSYVLTEHSASVNDVEFSKRMPYVLGSVSDDQSLRLFDTRATQQGKSVINTHVFGDNGHKNGINSLSFNPFMDHIVATGGADAVVYLWDLRSLKRPVYTLQGHSADVSVVEWSPHDDSVLASAGYDRRVNVWDLSLAELDLNDDDQSEGPPELLFVHGGHTNKILDISWHPTMPWTMASVSEDNVAQVWKVASSVAERGYHDEDEEEEGQEDARGEPMDKDEDVQDEKVKDTASAAEPTGVQAEDAAAADSTTSPSAKTSEAS